MKSTRKGFTLIELLVVIGIITVLIGILLPSLNAARRQAVLVQCLNNMRQVATGFTMYVSDYKGSLPGPLSGSIQPMYGRYNPAGNPDETLPSLLAPYTGCQLGYVASGNFVLNKMFKCPTWDSRGSFPDTCINSGSSTAAPAYPYETLMWEPNVYITNVGAPFGSSTASPLKLTKLYQSSITWAICEYDLQLAQTQTTQHVNPTTKLWLYPILPSHDKGRNVVYFDGHAETVPLNTLIADPIY